MADPSQSSKINAARRHGQRKNEWIVHLQRACLELEAQDENVAISKKQMASKLLRGGVLEPGRVETVFVVMFGNMHEGERRTGQAVPSLNRM